MSKRTTINFQPDKLARKLLARAVAARNNARGAQTKIINKALREHLKEFIGKRDLSLLEN